LPEGVVVEWEELSPLHFRYEVNAPEELMFRLFLFDFPGWTVRVDGEIVETELGRPEGFIVVPLTAGQHVVDVRFQDTPARTLAWVLSGLALLGTLAAALRISRVTPQPAPPTIHHSPFTLSDWWVLGTVLGITAVTLLILQPFNALHYNSVNYVVEPAQNRLFADFGEQIALTGFDAPATAAQPGDTMTVTLVLAGATAVRHQLPELCPRAGARWPLVAQSDHLNPANFPHGAGRWTNTCVTFTPSPCHPICRRAIMPSTSGCGCRRRAGGCPC
jgi:hypothetical protein